MSSFAVHVVTVFSPTSPTSPTNAALQLLLAVLLLLPLALGSTTLTCPQGKFASAPCPSYAVGYGDYCFASMDKKPATTGSGQCQSSYIAMPHGWELVPYSADVLTNVVAPHPFSTSCLVFENGASYYGANHVSSAGGVVGVESSVHQEIRTQ